MSEITIYPGKLKGIVSAPPSKSIAHRAVILAAVSKGDCLINNVSSSDDIEATINGMRAMGSRIEQIGNKLFVTRCVRNESARINCRESGSTMRFLIPVAAALGITAEFSGTGKLPERPVKEYAELFAEKGLNVKTKNNFLPLSVSGKLPGGVYEVSGEVSSQFVSGLLMAAPLTGERVDIVLKGKLQSAPYVDITIDVMNCFGVEVIRNKDGFTVPEGSMYMSNDYDVEGDYSQAAFWLTANHLGSDLMVDGLSEDSVQGDKAIVNVLEQLKGEGEVRIDASDIPDLVPIIAVASGLRPGKRTVIINAARLRMKESDRLHSTSALLIALGASCDEIEDGLIIDGVENYRGCTVDSFNDHRIAMAAAIASTRCDSPLYLLGYTSVKKSYPGFFDEFARLNGRFRK